jgi:predicted ATPase
MEHPVPPLSLPANDISTPEELLKTEGVKLFMERAVAVQPSFRLTRANASALASICRRLDGLPLAIELAAARVRVFTPEAILRALDHRLRFLNDGPRDAPSRQRTLRGAIGWSHDLLNPQERMVFRRLGVLAGTSDIETIEAVCNAGDGIPIVEILESLVLKNLVRQSAIDREPRFSMLETVREFAQEQLAATSEDLAVRRRQAAYFLTLIELGSQLRGGAVDEWLARLDVDQENIRAVLGWSANNDVSDTGIRLCARMYRFWYRRGHFVEGRDWCVRVLKAVHGAKPTPAIAEVLRTQGVLAYAQADYAAARELQ